MSKIPTDLSSAIYANDTIDIKPTAEEPETEEPETTDKPELHPLTIVIDTIVNSSSSYLKSKKLPPPDKEAYANIARPNLNEALNQLIPADADAKMNPYILLAFGFGGLALTYSPLIFDLVDKKITADIEAKKIENARKQRRIEHQHIEEETEQKEEQKHSLPPQILMQDEEPETEEPTINKTDTSNLAGHWKERIAMYKE